MEERRRRAGRKRETAMIVTTSVCLLQLYELSKCYPLSTGNTIHDTVFVYNFFVCLKSMCMYNCALYIWSLKIHRTIQVYFLADLGD